MVRKSRTALQEGVRVKPVDAEKILHSAFSLQLTKKKHKRKKKLPVFGETLTREHQPRKLDTYNMKVRECVTFSSVLLLLYMSTSHATPLGTVATKTLKPENPPSEKLTPTDLKQLFTLASKQSSKEEKKLSPTEFQKLVSGVADRVVSGRAAEALKKEKKLEISEGYLTPAEFQLLLAGKDLPTKKPPTEDKLTEAELQKLLSGAAQRVVSGKVNVLPTPQALVGQQTGQWKRVYRNGPPPPPRGVWMRRGGGPYNNHYHYHEGQIPVVPVVPAPIITYKPAQPYELHYPQIHHDEDARSRAAVLDAVWRALRSAAGGALAIGGTLARNGGRLLQAKGRIMASTGPLVVSLGKSVAEDALYGSHKSHGYHHGGYHGGYRTASHDDDDALSHVELAAAADAAIAQREHTKHIIGGLYEPFYESTQDLVSALGVAARGTARAVGDLVSELAYSAKRAYLLKE